MLEGERELTRDVVVCRGLAERGGVLREERARHVHAVEPHLVRIDPLVPEAARRRSRLGAKLVAQDLESRPVPRVAGLAQKGEEELSGIDEVEAVRIALVR